MRERNTKYQRCSPQLVKTKSFRRSRVVSKSKWTPNATIHPSRGSCLRNARSKQCLGSIRLFPRPDLGPLKRPKHTPLRIHTSPTRRKGKEKNKTRRIISIPPTHSRAPSAIAAAAIHHVGIVPTLALTAKQTLAHSGVVALLLVPQSSRVHDTRVRKIY